MKVEIALRTFDEYAGEIYKLSKLYVPIPSLTANTKPLYESENFRGIRSTCLKNGTYVLCCMNRVSTDIQAVIGFLCLYLLDQQDDGGGDRCFIFDKERRSHYYRPPHNYPMINMLLSLVHDCFFGMVMEAKCNQKYALLVGLEDEFIDIRWRDYEASEYIKMSVETSYNPLKNILDVLQDASNIAFGYGILDDVEPHQFMNGIISLCALSLPNLMTMFTKYNHESLDALDAFFNVCVDEFTASVQQAWRVNGGTETNRITISNDGKDPDEYFNMDGVESLLYYMETLQLP
jgi:hypothetical protein